MYKSWGAKRKEQELERKLARRLAREQAKNLTDTQKERARKAYKRVREWRKDNPEKLKAQQRRQYLKRKAVSDGYRHL